MFFLFNHRVTEIQASQARQQLGIGEILSPPQEILRLWAAIPPDRDALRPVLQPVFSWIDVTLNPGDYLLVQGDIGACYLVVEYVSGRGIIPVYSTTRREAQEQHLEDGTVRLLHTFRHVRFRKYGK